MTCAIDKDALLILLDPEDALHPEREQLQAHLHACADCRQAFESLQQVWQLSGSLPKAEPSEALGLRFYAALDSYAENQQSRRARSLRFPDWFRQVFSLQPRYQVAYSLLLLVAGLFAGILFYNRAASRAESNVAALSKEVHEMREMLMLSLLENPSPSERMRAVSYVNEIPELDKKIIDALFTTLNNDENVNVRLTTLETLAGLADNPAVREGLVQSIRLQESPLVQAAMADIMVKLQEKKAVKPLQKILRDPETNDMIKPKIAESIHKLS